MNAAQAWIAAALEGKSAELLREGMYTERPQLINALFERSCNLQCRHCLFSAEGSSAAKSRQAGLEAILANLIQQLGRIEPDDGWKTAFLHEGRVVKPWHLAFLGNMMRSAPTVSYGLIDNGTYTKHLDAFGQHGVQLDWLDISCDGTRDVHNSQRDPVYQRAYDQMIQGLLHSRKVTKPGGRVTSLMTLTSLNYDNVTKAADMLFEAPLIDEMHVSTMTPKQPENFNIELQVRHVSIAFEQFQRVQEQYKAYFRLYNTKHLALLAQAVGRETMRTALHNAQPLGHGLIILQVDGVPVYYAPSSTWPAEGIFLDTNGEQRVAYGQALTLQQLAKAENAKYTVQTLSPETDIYEAHRANIDHWLTHFGMRHFAEELSVVQKIYYA